MTALLAFAITGILAAIGGGLELVTRHPAQPMKPLQTGTGQLYIVVNAAAGVTALYLGVVYEVLPNIFDPELSRKESTTAVLTAGTASLVILRSSLLTVRVDGKDVNFGPSFFISSILNILQREIERELAPGTAQIIARAQNYGFKKMLELVVPVIKSTFTENADQQRIQETIDRLKGQEDVSDESKAAELTNELHNIAGKFLNTVFDDVDKTFQTRGGYDAEKSPEDEDLLLQDLLDLIPVAESKAPEDPETPPAP